jgi:hypothetical protein
VTLGVPMDTSAGRTRMRGIDTSTHTGQTKVCHLCHDAGHIRSACPLKGDICAHPSRVQALQLQASRFRGQNPRNGGNVMDLPGPPLAQTNSKKIDALKRHAQEITRDLRSRDDIQISYLETLEERDNDNLRLAQMLAR